jgi:hypothetical protein
MDKLTGVSDYEEWNPDSYQDYALHSALCNNKQQTMNN